MLLHEQEVNSYLFQLLHTFGAFILTVQFTGSRCNIFCWPSVCVNYLKAIGLSTEQQRTEPGWLCLIRPGGPWLTTSEQFPHVITSHNHHGTPFKLAVFQSGRNENSKNLTKSHKFRSPLIMKRKKKKTTTSLTGNLRGISKSMETVNSVGKHEPNEARWNICLALRELAFAVTSMISESS